MKKVRLILLALAMAVFQIFVFVPAQSQQKPIVSQYMFNNLVLNPAYAGVHEHLNATMAYRDQWVNMDGAPTTKSVSIHSGIKDKNIGLGMLIVNDKIGVHEDNSAYLSYSYKIRFKHANLSMGLQAGFNYLNSDFSRLNLKYAEDPLLNSMIGDFKMNFGTGLYFNTKTSYIGFSIPFIRKKRLVQDFSMQRAMEESRYYYLTAGKVLDLSYRVKVKPSFLLKVEEGMPVTGDVNINFFIDDLLNIGASYRTGDSFVGLFDVKISDYFRLGYAYDYTISDLARYTYGSHEIMLNYRINLFAPRKHKMCPGPYYF
ncbi:MAG: PorP/SprF family type IX secretion system membrane protein [Candidatus Cyclobacteriaceae bacterium M3_2C_046]